MKLGLFPSRVGKRQRLDEIHCVHKFSVLPVDCELKLGLKPGWCECGYSSIVEVGRADKDLHRSSPVSLLLLGQKIRVLAFRRARSTVHKLQAGASWKEGPGLGKRLIQVLIATPSNTNTSPWVTSDVLRQGTNASIPSRAGSKRSLVGKHRREFVGKYR
jgi:hypothetical protein